MRLSVNDDIAQYYEVYLDGVKVNYWEADVANGWVEVFKRPPFFGTIGNLTPNLTKKYGTVELVNKETGKVIRNNV